MDTELRRYQELITEPKVHVQRKATGLDGHNPNIPCGNNENKQRKDTYISGLMHFSVGGLFKRGEVDNGEVTRSLLRDMAAL